MHKPGQDVWTALDGADVHRMERTADKSLADKQEKEATDFSKVDFEGAEKIELTGGEDTSRYSNLQYFSTREEFEDRLNALMSWTSKANLSTIYGIITIRDEFLEVDNEYLERAQNAITRFEDFFVKNIRVPRKYTPPPAHGGNKRKSDDPGYKNIRGNFDLVCRTPSSHNNPHMLEFVLYDCGYQDALKKLERFKKFAKELSLILEIEISHYTGQKLNR